MTSANPDKGQTRLLRFLAKGPAEIAGGISDQKLTLESAAHGAISVDRAVLKAGVSSGVVTLRRDRLSLSDAGRARLRRLASPDPYAGQHRVVTAVSIEGPGGAAKAHGNHSESPLSMLRNRKDASGAPIIGEAAFKAGERLRADYTIGNLMPSIGVNWNIAGSGSRSNGVIEITDAALAARQRVEQALAAVGPELCGVLVDVCCYLKGLELVERERQWPARSAKLILKTALAALDRHYHPAARERTRPRIIHWGTEDYRPVL